MRQRNSTAACMQDVKACQHAVHSVVGGQCSAKCGTRPPVESEGRSWPLHLTDRPPLTHSACAGKSTCWSVAMPHRGSYQPVGAWLKWGCTLERCTWRPVSHSRPGRCPHSDTMAPRCGYLDTCSCGCDRLLSKSTMPLVGHITPAAVAPTHGAAARILNKARVLAQVAHAHDTCPDCE